MLITHPLSSTLLRGAFVATVTADRDPRITQMDYFLKLFDKTDKTHTEGIFTEVRRRGILGSSAIQAPFTTMVSTLPWGTWGKGVK
jgi:hypothetical protein